MNIDNWPMDRIMRLPDWCFGRKYVVSCELLVPMATTMWDLSEVTIPENFILWQLQIVSFADPGTTAQIRMALGDQLPTAAAMMNALQPLVFGLGVQGAEPRQIRVFGTGIVLDLNLSMPIKSVGRRLVLEATAPAGTVNYARVAAVVSGMPKEVPDWLISESGKNLI